MYRNILLGAFICGVLATSVGYSDNAPVNTQVQTQTWNHSDQSWDDQGSYNSNVSYSNGQDGCCPADKACGDCWCKYCRYCPCYHNEYHCVKVPQHSTCCKCRYVPKYYECQRCRYVPQYYCETYCRYEPEYYNEDVCTYCDQWVAECKCDYVPQYYWKHECQPECGNNSCR